MTAYDRFAYPTLPFLESHPDRLALVGHLLGMTPAPAARCRVLELACGDGGNLLPMAEMFPESRFVGVDAARARVDEGAAVAAALGLGNLRLEARDLGDTDGEFDYVIAHGVYSWVAPAVQRRLLDTVAARLAPGGIAFLSHNVLPGWHARGLVRAMLRRRVAAVADEGDRVARARALLEALAGGATDPLWRAVLARERDAVRAQPDGLVYHDLLGAETGAGWFDELAAELPARGLAWLGDADVGTLAAAGGPGIDREQLADDLAPRAFRMSLLCRADAPLDRGHPAGRLAGLHVSSRATRGDGGEFHAPRGVTVRVARPESVAALEELAQVWPASLPARALAGAELFGLFVAGVVELSLRPAALTATAGAHPTAAPYARWQAARGRTVTNRRHESVTLGDEQAALLARCDGTRDREALARAAGLPLLRVEEELERLGYGALLTA